ITVPVPAGAATGWVVVTVGGAASNNVIFTVLPIPSITNISPSSGPMGSLVTISGTNFGVAQGTSTVTFNGASAGAASSWSATSLAVLVPAAATTGNVVVTVSGVASNGLTFAIGPDITPPTAPTNLSETAISAGSVSISWGVSTDNVGVTSYLVERCQGVGCTTYAQIGSAQAVSTAMVATTGASTSYSYRMRATHAP